MGDTKFETFCGFYTNWVIKMMYWAFTQQVDMSLEEVFSPISVRWIAGLDEDYKFDHIIAEVSIMQGINIFNKKRVIHRFVYNALIVNNIRIPVEEVAKIEAERSVRSILVESGRYQIPDFSKM